MKYCFIDANYTKQFISEVPDNTAILMDQDGGVFMNTCTFSNQRVKATIGFAQQFSFERCTLYSTSAPVIEDVNDITFRWCLIMVNLSV